MKIEATSHGHDAAAGMPNTSVSGSAQVAAPIPIRIVVESGSSVRLIAAFQPAWQAAAIRTAKKTNASTYARCNAAPGQSFGAEREYCGGRATSAPSSCAACQP